MARYAVTGAAGFIGSHLAEALVAAGHEVVGIDSFTDYYDPALKEENAAGFDVSRLDLAEEDLALDGFDGVFHLAGQPGVRSFGDVFEDYLRRNLGASRRVFESAAAAGARVVFTSSSSIYGEAESYPTREDAQPRPISPYGITKLGCEQLAYAYAKGFGLDVVVLRYFTFYGPRQRPDMALTRVVDALAHDEITFEHVVNSLQATRDPGRHPLFQAAFSLEPTLPSLPAGWAFTQLDVDTGTTKFDLYLELDDRAEGIIGRFMYRTDLFEAETITRMAARYRTLLEAVVGDPDRPLSMLPLLPPEERRLEGGTSQFDAPVHRIPIEPGR